MSKMNQFKLADNSYSSLSNSDNVLHSSSVPIYFFTLTLPESKVNKIRGHSSIRPSDSTVFGIDQL